MKFIPELQQPQPNDYKSQQTRNQQAGVLGSLNPKSSKTTYTEPLKQNNPTLMLPGDHPSLTSSKQGGVITGFPGTVMQDCTVESSLLLSGARIQGVVQVTASGILILNSCYVEQTIQVESGGRIHLIGCFHSGCNNAGAPANGFIQGCHKLSGGNTNMTVISET